MSASVDAIFLASGDPLGVSDAVIDAADAAPSNATLPSVESDPQDAISFLYQVDCSPILDEDDQPVAIFQHPRAKMDVALDATLLIGLDTALYTAQLPTGGQREIDDAKPLAQLALLAAEDELELEDEELISDVKWIDNERFAVSYSSGVLRIFHREGRLQYAQKFHHAAILKLDISPSVSTKIASNNSVREVDMQVPEAASASSTAAASVGSGELWVLYEDATVAIVQVQELLLRIRAAVYGPAQANKFRKYALRDQSNITAVAPCGPSRPTIFQSHPRLGVHTVVSVGTGPFLSFYHAGNDQNSIIHLAHIATAIASRAAGAVWTFAKSWGWSSGASPNNVDGDGTTGDANASGEMRAVDAAAEHVAAPVGSVRAFPEDARRRARMLVLSPTGRLAAISDTLGRILLVDTTRMAVIRMWKGYRYAQVGWMHGTEGKRRSRGLYLVIYSAQRGIVEVWRTRYGPRVFSFAVGNNARLFTHVDRARQQRARCMVLSENENGLAELIDVQPHAPSVSILVKYFTQNKLQEENFVLHQIIGAIQAYVKKKRADAPHHHTLEQDSIDPVLSDIENLSSTTSIQALLDVLLSPEMSALSASFVLRVLERLQPAIRNGMESRSPTGTELSLLWQLQWRHRILSAFVGLQTEYLRARHVLQTAIKDTSAMLAKHVAPDRETGTSRSRLVPWLELYRRAGHSWSEDNNEGSRQASARAAELTWWEFMEYFSMPFADSELPRRRDIVALYEQTERTEDFLREALRLLSVPVFRSSIRPPQLATLTAFLFTPVLSNVFAVQELQQLHASIFVTPKTHTFLFIEWYFALPIGSILAIPPPSPSCAFQRWLTPYIGAPDIEETNEDDEEVSPSNKRRLSSCSDPMAQLFCACVRSQRLVHAFILSEQCRWGEQQQSKAIEESTLGKHSSVDGGLRWSIVQDCLAKAVHVALRLGRLGKTSIEGVENVDEVIRLVALMQLNEGFDLEENHLELGLHQLQGVETVPNTATATSLVPANDPWVASLEHCRTSAQMKSWRSVLESFRQFADKDALLCFRASLLCAAWNAERSDMHQLEDAISEVKALSSRRLRVAMGVHIWERYIRVHVVTLISFWEESAAGRKPQRGLQPQIARRFFSIIHGLLRVLISAWGEIQSSGQLGINRGPQGDDGEDEEEDNEGFNAGERDDGYESDEERPATAVMENLTSRKRWSTPVRDLRRVFDEKWPPSYASSSLMQSLYEFPVTRVSASRLGDHLSLILLLDSFAATSVTPVSIVKLFHDKGRDLCRPDSFMEDANTITRSVSAADKRALDKERTQFLRQLLHHDNDLGFALAESFRLPTEFIREEYVIFLYQSGQDEQADFAFEKIKHPERLVPQLGAIARARLSLTLQRMKAEVEYAMIMSILPADLFMWIVADKLPPFVADRQVVKLDAAPSLTGTSMILLRCLSLMPPTGPEFDKISAMSVLVKDIITRVKHMQQQQSSGGD